MFIAPQLFNCIVIIWLYLYTNRNEHLSENGMFFTTTHTTGDFTIHTYSFGPIIKFWWRSRDCSVLFTVINTGSECVLSSIVLLYKCKRALDGLLWCVLLLLFFQHLAHEPRTRKKNVGQDLILNCHFWFHGDCKQIVYENMQYAKT